MGRKAFEKTFKLVFDQIGGGKTIAPYMDIRPKDLEVQVFGDVAIATFHLDDRVGLLNRRTIVLNRTKEGWENCALARIRGFRPSGQSMN